MTLGRRRPAWFEWVVVCAATLAAVLPLLLGDVPGLVDLPNNIARLQIREELYPGSWYAAFYAANSLAIPNAAFDLFGGALDAWLPPAALGRAFAVLSVVLTTTGAAALARAFGQRASLAAVLAAAIAHNYATTSGLLNYAAGLGIALWAAWVWLRLRRAQLALRWFVGCAAAFVLYFCHLFALGTYGLVVLGIELPRARRPAALGGGWWRLGLLGATMLPVIGLLFAGPAVGETQVLEWEGPVGALRNSAKALHGGLGVADYVHLAGLLGLWAILRRTGRLCITPRARLPLGLLVVATLLCPDATLEASCLQQRLPVAVALFVAASLRWRRRRGPGWLVPLSIAVVLGERTVALVEGFAERAAVTERAAVLLGEVPEGACLFTLHFTSEDPWQKYRAPIKHTACLVALDRQVFLPQLLVADFHHTLRAAPGFAMEMHQVYETRADFGSSAELRERVAELARLWRERRRDAAGAKLTRGLYLFVVQAAEGLELPLDLVEWVAGKGDAILLRLRE